MAIYAFYPNATHQRRSDGIGFVLAEGADEASASDAAQALVAGTSIADFAAVEIGAGIPAVAVQGLPVGARGQTTSPLLTRGGGFLSNVA
jgi:hypothetical protein